MGLCQYIFCPYDLILVYFILLAACPCALNVGCALILLPYPALQVGLSQARRMAQGSVIRIHISSAFPVQIDGEPFILQPGCLEISHHKQVCCDIQSRVHKLLCSLLLPLFALLFFPFANVDICFSDGLTFFFIFFYG